MPAGEIRGEESQSTAECPSSEKESDESDRVSAKVASAPKINGSEKGSLLPEDNPDGVIPTHGVLLTNGVSAVRQNGTSDLQKTSSMSTYSTINVAQFSPISDADSAETELEDGSTTSALRSCNHRNTESPIREMDFSHEIVAPRYIGVHSSTDLPSELPDPHSSSIRPARLAPQDLSASAEVRHPFPSNSQLHLQPQVATSDQHNSTVWVPELRIQSPFEDKRSFGPGPQPELTSPPVRSCDGVSTTEEEGEEEEEDVIGGGDSDRLPPLNLSVLADAAKCVQMEQSLREARDFLDGLLTRLSVPADLCTSFENLLSDGEEEVEGRGEGSTNYGPRPGYTMPRPPVYPKTVPKVPNTPAFSPVFKHLLSLPESQVLSGVSALTPAYRCLLDLCGQFYAAIDQSKKKLRQIQRIRGRRRREERLERERTQQQQQGVKPCEVDSPSRRQDALSRRHQKQQELAERRHRFTDALGQLVTAASSAPSSAVPLGPEAWPLPPRLASPGYSNPSECPLSFLSLLTSIKAPSPTATGKSEASAQELVVDTSSSGLHTNDSGLHSLSDLGPSLSVSPAVASEPLSPSRPRLASLSKFRGRRFSGSSHRRKSFSTRTSQASRKISGQSDKDAVLDPPRSATVTADFPQKTFPRVPRVCGDEKGLTDTASSFSSLQESQHDSVAKSLTVVVKGFADECPDNILSPLGNGLVEAAPATSSISPSTSSLTTADTFSPSIRVTSTVGPSAEMSPTTKHRHGSGSPAPSSLLCLPEEEEEVVVVGRRPPTSVWVDAAAGHTWNHDDKQDEGPANHHHPTPSSEPSILKLQRIDLDLADLSDGLRILLIEDTHLRAGTLHSVASSEGEELPDCVDRTSALNRLFRIQLDGDKSASALSTLEPASRLSPKTSGLSPSPLSGTGRSTERRRQGEAILQGWQLPQQAVLEVIPALSRQLPPGTRVCASWSEKLAAYLYPGRVSDKDPMSTTDPDSVCVSFDDGDEREVHISKIRILPDNFANLTELREAAALLSPLSPENFARARHASASSVLFKSSKRRRRCSVDRLNPMSSDVSDPGSVVFSASRSNSTSLKRRRLRREISEDVDGSRQSLDVKVEGLCGLAAEHTTEHENRNDRRDSNAGSTVDPAKAVAPTILWKPKGKTRRRYQGMNCYRALERKTDGLRVFVGDVVEFNSGRNGTVYLGEVRQICYSSETSAPVVFASWFYYPDEAGPDGRLVEGWKGAIFSSSHTDENEAECIIGRVGVAPTLAEFRSANEEHSNRRSKKSSERVRADSLQMSDQELGRNASRQPKSPSKRRRSETVNRHGRKGCSAESSEEDQADVPRYFVAGRFDPVANRVLSWDADLARTLQLPSEVDNFTFTSSDPDLG
ncbi:BAH domain and coiled-coil containing 1 [Sparganum proliferum]